MYGKRGLSTVVTTVLFILLALAAIVIIWGFVSNFFGGAELDTSEITERHFIVYDSVLDNTEENYVELIVKRDTGRMELSGMMVVLENMDGDAISNIFDGEVDKVGKKITYDYEDSFGTIKFVSIVPVFLDGKVGIETDRYELKDSDRVMWISHDTGWISPSVVENFDNGGSAWDIPSNAEVEDGVNTVAPVGPLASDYLKASHFNFGIPDSARIIGINVQVERFFSDGPPVADSLALLVDSNGDFIVGTDKAEVNVLWPFSDPEVMEYGVGDSDLWGMDEGSLDGINVNDNFGFALVAYPPISISPTKANVDYIKMKIHYELLEQA